MDLHEQLKIKQDEINKVVSEINQFQQALNTKNQEALRLDGAIRILNELIESEKSKEEIKKVDTRGK